jgi:hypothetical protein
LAAVKEIISDGLSKNRPVTYEQLADAIEYNFSKIVSTDALRHIIARMDDVKTVVGIPKEKERVDVDPAVVDKWYDDLVEEIDGIPRQFIFNVDETGCCEYADRREICVVVPASYAHASIDVAVDRHTKRSTLTACIAADGYRAKPFIILHRSTIERELHLYGYTPENVAFATQQHAYMTGALFEEWAREVFFPAVEQRRAVFNYDGKVLLLMDGFGAHHTDAFMDECRRKNIKVVFFVPHASDQLQPLDLLTFGMLKKKFSGSKFNRLTNPQSNTVVKILAAWFAASAPHHNVEAFMNLGLIPYHDPRTDTHYLRVDRTQAREVRGRDRGQPVALEIPRAPLPAAQGQRRWSVRPPNTRTPSRR